MRGILIIHHYKLIIIYNTSHTDNANKRRVKKKKNHSNVTKSVAWQHESGVCLWWSWSNYSTNMANKGAIHTHTHFACFFPFSFPLNPALYWTRSSSSRALWVIPTFWWASLVFIADVDSDSQQALLESLSLAHTHIHTQIYKSCVCVHILVYYSSLGKYCLCSTLFIKTLHVFVLWTLQVSYHSLCALWKSFLETFSLALGFLVALSPAPCDVAWFDLQWKFPQCLFGQVVAEVVEECHNVVVPLQIVVSVHGTSGEKKTISSKWMNIGISLANTDYSIWQ